MATRATIGKHQHSYLKLVTPSFLLRTRLQLLNTSSHSISISNKIYNQSNSSSIISIMTDDASSNKTLIELSNPGDRLAKVTLEVAEALTARWESELAAAATSDPHFIVDALDLSCRVYPPASAAHICSFLKDKVGNLRIALLNDIIASLPTDEGLATLEFVNALLEESPLVELNLDDNALGIRGVERCFGILSRPTLERLSIRNDGLSAESMPIIGDAMSTKCEKKGTCALDNIKELNIYNNMIGAAGAAATGTILKQCLSLEHLQYEGCRPGPDGSRALVEGLLAAATTNTNNTTMRSLQLELSLGKTASEPLGVLCKALQTDTKLQLLKLYDCGLEASGCKLVLKSLPPNHSGLVTLAMAQNEMDATTVRKYMIPVLKRNLSTLQVLQLENNEITSVGVESLCDVIASSEGAVALKELKLTENMIGSRGVTALIATKGSMPHLTLLTMESNGFPGEVVEELKECYDDEILQDMEELEEDDYDEDLEDEEESDDDENDKQEDGNDELGALANTMGKMKLRPDDVSL